MKRFNLAFIVGFILIISNIEAAEDTNKSNIALIFVDDMGYADPICYGGTMVKTPLINELAINGVKFNNGYVASPACSPSRAGLLTSAYTNRFGVYWNQEASHTVMPDEQVLLPELVRSAGYKPGVIGKWNIVNITLDSYPTIANLIGAEIPNTVIIEGIDLMPYLTKYFRQPIHQQLLWSRGNKWDVIRDGDFNLNITNGKPMGLYNLKREISEINDISACWPNVVGELFQGYMKQFNSFPHASVYNMENNFEKKDYHPYGDNPPLKKVLE
jgi:arylsulfatase A-like enzyme